MGGGIKQRRGVEQQVSHLRRNVVEMDEGEVDLNWDSSAFVAEHMSMEVAPRWNPREGWFKKDVVQPMEAWAEFTPYLASVAMTGPFEQRVGSLRTLSWTYPRPNRFCICLWWWEVR